ncbi:MAG: tetratricopeptide repeat protein [Acidobacteria bacterium]|nr:tetratricopeptide repeat protein [Acidobacteriota bacterium]
MNWRSTLTALAAAAVVAAAGAASGQTTRDEEFARRQYDAGLAFLRDGRYAEALKDFQAVVDGFASSSLADDAMLRIAEYHLDVAGDPATAMATVEALLKRYPSGTAAPFAHVLAGRVALAGGRGEAQLSGALASFDRAVMLYPRSLVVPEATFHAGEALQSVRQHEEALERFVRVSLEYPATSWAIRADLAAARSLVATGRAAAAPAVVQRARSRALAAGDAALADEALRLNTILYRLYLKPQARSRFGFGQAFAGGRQIRDVVAMRFAPAGDLWVATSNGAVGYAAADGSPAGSLASAQGRGLTVLADGSMQLVHRGGLQGPRTPPRTFAAADGRPLDDVAAAVGLSTGDVVVADRRRRAVLRFAPDGRPGASFAAVNASALAVSPMDEVAALDRDAKSVAVFDRDGRPVTRIATKGTGYQLNNPVDVAFDTLGHLYVADRNTGQVLVFDLRGSLVTTVASDRVRQPAAIAVDAAGRLYVADDRARQVLVFR